MYIEIHNLDIKQEALYFKLNSAFSLETIDGLNEKIKGVYAIYKDNICLYVGQSKNIASRIATHLRGKYQEATSIYIWDVRNIGFSNFMERSAESQKSILNNCEQSLMVKLKPIENLLINMDKEIPTDQQPNICFESFADFTIHNQECYLSITDSSSFIVEGIEVAIDIMNHNSQIDSTLHKNIRKEISDCDVKQFCDLGVKNEA